MKLSGRMKAGRRGPLTASALVMAAALGAAGQASAAEGWYARAEIGLSGAADADVDAAAPIAADVEVDDADVVSAAFGREWGKWRFEAELSRHQSSFDPSLSLDEGGSFDATALLVSLYRDFSLGVVTPFVGVGLGIAQSNFEASNAGPITPVSIDDEHTGFAYQFAAGAFMPLTERVGVDLTYRFFEIPEFSGEGMAAAEFRYEGEFDQQSIALGLRWIF